MAANISDQASVVFEAYKPLINFISINSKTIGSAFHPFPRFSEQFIRNLCNQTRHSMITLPTVIRTNSPIMILGDIHGSIFDLLQILSFAFKNGFPETKLLFLGDYVDRGNYSIEVITLLFSLFCLYPSSVILLRGNHEFSSINSTYGFKKEIEEYYSNQLWIDFNLVFDLLPLSAVVDDIAFCVHGGISPHATKIHQIERINRPFQVNEEFLQKLVTDLMWSDPVDNSSMFTQNGRGKGTEFGLSAVINFFEENNLKYIFRAHQSFSSGIVTMMGKRLISLFSTTNYKIKGSCYCGSVIFQSGKAKPKLFEQILEVPKEEVVYRNVEDKRQISFDKIHALTMHLPRSCKPQVKARYKAIVRSSISGVISRTPPPPVIQTIVDNSIFNSSK